MAAALADQLDALLGNSARGLRRLPVDLDELAGILEGDPMYGGGRVDLATGEVWPAPAVDYAREIGQEDEDESDDPDKWLWVHCEGSRDGYRDMELFIGTVRDPGRADRLEIAISGRGASGGLRMCWRAGPENWIGGMRFPRSVSVAGPGPGWPTPVTTSARGFLLHDPASLRALLIRVVQEFGGPCLRFCLGYKTARDPDETVPDETVLAATGSRAYRPGGAAAAASIAS